MADLRALATPEDVARFMSFVDILPCGCWFWTGARSRGAGNRKWYGTFNAGAGRGGRVRAHRYACEVIADRGPLPPGHHRDHTCKFSLCVNPFKCIEYVTHEVNQQRKVSGHHRFQEAAE